MDTTLGERFFSDKTLNRVLEEALTLLSHYQKEITGVIPPKTALKESYENALKRLSDIRGTPLYFPYLGSGMGRGPLVELLDGSVKYDMISGIGPYFFGHSNHRLIKASLLGALSDTIMQGNLQQNGIALEVVERFKKLSGLNHCFLTSSGAMALENAMKIAFQSRKGSYRILAFEGCFSGRTLTLSQITDKPAFREGLPSFVHVDYLPFSERASEQLDVYLKRYPGEHAFILIEPIQGEGGFRPGSNAFFTPLLERLKKEGILVLFDEIQTFGRTEQPFAFQTFDLSKFADIVTVGKMSNICATLYQDHLRPKGGLLSQTFTGATTALFGCLETLKMFEELPLFGPEGKNAKIFAWCKREMEKLSLEGPFGKGSMVAFVPHGGKEADVKAFLLTLFEKGVIAFSAGSNPTKVRMLPPAPVLEEADIQKIFSLIKETLDVHPA